MTPGDLEAFRDRIRRRFADHHEVVDTLPIASADALSADTASDILAEGVFLRAFVAYEQDVEALFLHYATGCPSLNGSAPNTYLRVADEALARKIAKAGFRFMSWAKPSQIKATAENFIERGWPLVEMMAAKEHVLADCERIRNRIAHNSAEASQEFAIVQRNAFGTERLFPIPPGQLLRVRNARLKKTLMMHYTGAFQDTLEAMIEPQP